MRSWQLNAASILSSERAIATLIQYAISVHVISSCSGAKLPDSDSTMGTLAGCKLILRQALSVLLTRQCDTSTILRHCNVANSETLIRLIPLRLCLGVIASQGPFPAA